MIKDQAQTVIFITGAFLHHSCWDEWRSSFESQGYKTLAPPWPFKDASAEALRNSHPNAEIASNRLTALTEYFGKIVRQVQGDTILVGHSLGGLIVQLLLQKEMATCGIAIHPVAPAGVFTFKLSFLKAGWGALGFFTPVKQSYLVSFQTWTYGFANGMDCETQKDLYYKFAIPESKKVVRDTLTKAAKVHFKKSRPPLLIISGTDDRSIPASLNHTNYKKYDQAKAPTDYWPVENTNHLSIVDTGWKNTAGYILDWMKRKYQAGQEYHP